MPENFEYPIIVSSLALLVYYYTLYRAGTSRAKYKVDAPSHSGPPEYERIVRVHQNTLEHLAIFLPSLWLFALTVGPLWAAGIGIIWPFARLAYAFGYYADPQKRLIGLIASLPPIYIFVPGSLIAAVMKLV